MLLLVHIPIALTLDSACGDQTKAANDPQPCRRVHCVTYNCLSPHVCSQRVWINPSVLRSTPGTSRLKLGIRLTFDFTFCELNCLEQWLQALLLEPQHKFEWNFSTNHRTFRKKKFSEFPSAWLSCSRHGGM